MIIEYQFWLFLTNEWDFCVLQKIDVNQDGLITFEELSQWCTGEDQFIKSLGMLDTVLWSLSKKKKPKKKPKKCNSISIISTFRCHFLVDHNPLLLESYCYIHIRSFIDLEHVQIIILKNLFTSGVGKRFFFGPRAAWILACTCSSPARGPNPVFADLWFRCSSPFSILDVCSLSLSLSLSLQFDSIYHVQKRKKSNKASTWAFPVDWTQLLTLWMLLYIRWSTGNTMCMCGPDIHLVKWMNYFI